MRKETRIKDFAQMHRSLVDPEEREKAKRHVDRERRREEKRTDTGL